MVQKKFTVKTTIEHTFILDTDNLVRVYDTSLVQGALEREEELCRDDMEYYLSYLEQPEAGIVDMEFEEQV